jgi:cell division protein FtsZ
MIDFELIDKKNSAPNVSIKVIGVGGAGGNTINSIIPLCQGSIECIAANTDTQALELSQAEKKIRLGIKSTRGLGTGADPEQGKRAAEEDIDKVLEAVDAADIVFLTGGMGGGTASGSLPVIARELRKKGILTIAVVTKPFTFEGKKREKTALEAIERLSQVVDTLIVIPNQKLLEVVDHQASMIDAFEKINEVLGQSVKAISDIITRPGRINVDYADVCRIMRAQGLAVMGTAQAKGQNRAQEATLKAISSPLLENMSIHGACSVLLNITGSKNLGLYEVSEAANIIYGQVDEDAQIILGSVIDESMNDEVRVTIIATGFRHTAHTQQGVVCSLAEPIEAVQEPVATDLSLVEKKDIIIESAPIAVSAAIEASEVPEKKEEAAEVTYDINDLDVPTFLRTSQELEK